MLQKAMATSSTLSSANTVQAHISANVGKVPESGSSRNEYLLSLCITAKATPGWAFRPGVARQFFPSTH
jgi:hypothetical protein